MYNNIKNPFTFLRGCCIIANFVRLDNRFDSLNNWNNIWIKGNNREQD